jgi:hypothetical protein
MDDAERIPIDIGYEVVADAAQLSDPRVTMREDGTVVMNIMVPQPCESEASTDDEIVVCADAPDSDSDMRVPSTADDKAAAAAAAARTPCAGCVVVSGASVRIGFGQPPPAPLMIDLKSIPEAPPGSDAARYQGR